MAAHVWLCMNVPCAAPTLWCVRKQGHASQGTWLEGVLRVAEGVQQRDGTAGIADCLLHVHHIGIYCDPLSCLLLILCRAG